MSINGDKGFGFIRSSKEDRDYYFNLRDISRSLLEDMDIGMEVKYEIIKSRNKHKKGELNAVNIAKLPAGSVKWDEVPEEASIVKGVVTKALAPKRNSDFRSNRMMVSDSSSRYGRFTILESSDELTSGDKDKKEEEHNKAPKTIKFLQRSIDVFTNSLTSNGEVQKVHRLKSGDICEFKIAIEKRTKLEHAVNIKLVKTHSNYVKDCVSSALRSSEFKVEVHHGIISESNIQRSTKGGRRKEPNFITPVGKLKDILSFDTNIQPEKRYQIKDEVSFSILDVPIYDGSKETNKIVCNVRKLKPGTVKLEHVIAENAVAYIVKELKFTSQHKSMSRAGRSSRNRNLMNGFGTGGILQFENSSLLLENGVEASSKSVKKNNNTKKKILKSSNKKKKSAGEVKFTSDQVSFTMWSWLGRDIPATFKCGDAVFVRVTRPNVGKSRDITISNIRMKDPYARGSRVQRLSRCFGTIGTIRNGYGLVRRGSQSSRGRQNEVFFHFSSVFHLKSTPGIDDASKKGAGMHDSPPPPLKEGDEVSFEVEEDKNGGDKAGHKRFVATRVLVLERGTISARKNSVIAKKVLGTVLTKASNKGPGRTTSLNGTILVDLSSVRSLDKMFPLLHAQILDFSDSKAARVAIPIKNKWEDLKKQYLSKITAKLNMMIVKEGTDGKKVSCYEIEKKQGNKDGSKKDNEPFFKFASSPKLEVKFSKDAVANIRTTVGEGDTVEFQLCSGPNGVVVAQEISVKEKAKKKEIVYGIVASVSRKQPIGFIECMSHDARYFFHHSEVQKTAQRPSSFRGDHRKSGSDKRQKFGGATIRINDEVSFVISEVKKRHSSDATDDKNLCASSIRILNTGTLRKKFGPGYRLNSLEGTMTNIKYVGTVMKENSDYAPKRPAKRHSKYKGVDIRDMRYLLGKINIHQDDLTQNMILELNKVFKAMTVNQNKGAEKIENEAQEVPEEVASDSSAKTTDNSTTGESQNGPVEIAKKGTGYEGSSIHAEVETDQAPEESASKYIDENDEASEEPSTKSEDVNPSSSDNTAQRIAYFRLDDMDLNKGNESSVVPRIGDVVEFELAKDKVLSKLVFAQNIVLKTKGGILDDTGVVDATKEGRYGYIKSYESKYRSIQFNFSDVVGDNVVLKEGDEVKYRLVALREQRKPSRNGDASGTNEEFRSMRAVDVKLIKAAPEFRRNRQRINQSLLQERLNTGDAKGGLVVSRISKAPNGTDRGFSQEYQSSRNREL